jgi:hypothetical protein
MDQLILENQLRLRIEHKLCQTTTSLLCSSNSFPFLFSMSMIPTKILMVGYARVGKGWRGWAI